MKSASDLILLAENNEGYANLCKIVSKGFVEGFYYKPRVDYEVLEKYHEGIICLSACLAGEVQKYLARGEYEKGKEAALKYGIPSPSTVLMWQRKYKNVGLSGLHGGSRLWSEDMITKENDLFKEPEEFVDPKPKDNKDLLKEIELLKAENAYLKKLRALVQERIARESKKGLPPSKN